MILRLHRDVLLPTYTLGVLTVDYEDGRGPLSFGFTVEDTDRGLYASDPIASILARKVADQTCIPYGRFRVKTTMSAKYGRMMPLILDTPGFRGCRIHSGNSDQHTSGCVLPGMTRDVTKGTVGKSRVACAWLYTEIARVEAGGGNVWIEIVRA